MTRKCPRPHCGGDLAPSREEAGLFICGFCAREFRLFLGDPLELKPREPVREGGKEVKRYLGNESTKVAHDRSQLREECNTDAIEEKREMDETEWMFAMESGEWRPCEHCFRPRVYR